MYIIEEYEDPAYWNEHYAKLFGEHPGWQQVEDTGHLIKEDAEQQATTFRNRSKNAGITYRVVEVDSA